MLSTRCKTFIYASEYPTRPWASQGSFSSLCSWTCGWFNGGNHCVQRNDAEMHCWDLAVTYISVLSPIGPLHLTCSPISCYWRFLKCAMPGLSKWCTPCLECLSLIFFFFLVNPFHPLKIIWHLWEIFILCALMDFVLIVIKPSSHPGKSYKANRYDLFLVSINLTWLPGSLSFIANFTFFLYSDHIKDKVLFHFNKHIWKKIFHKLIHRFKYTY